jgi:LysM repeat protein
VGHLIARSSVVDPQAIDLNNLVDPYTLYPGDVIKISSGRRSCVSVRRGAPIGSGTTYTVQLGDYVSSIAVQFGVTSDAIVSANNLTYPYTLYPGQVLTIP